MDIPVQFIRQLAKQGKYKFSEHATQRINERMIRKSKVLEAIVEGEAIESQDHGRDIKILFQEATDEKPLMYVVVAITPSLAEIVTVAKTKEEAWKVAQGRLRRK